MAGEEFVAAAVADHGSEPLGLVIMRKLGVSEIGKGVYGAVVDDPRIVSAAKQILRQLNWRGPLELEFILPNGAKAPILVEINCRFPSWIMLTHWAGANLPALLLREILQPGRSGPCAAKAGTSFIRDIVETAVPHGELRNLQRGRNCVGTPMDTPSIRRGDPDGVRVAISGVGTLDVVNAGLGVGRALRLAPDIAAIYGLGYGNFDSGLYRNDLFDIAFRLPASDDPSALLRRLTEIHGEMPFDVIIPCLDGEIPRYIEIRRALEKLGVRMLLPSIESFERCTKTALFCGHVREDWGSFSVPQAIQVRSEDEVETAADGVGFPVAVKGPISHALRADNMAEAGAAWTILRDKGLREALVQPYIEGDQFAVAAVCGTDSRPIAMMTIKKLRVCGRGSTWSAVRIDQLQLEADFSEFLRAIEWVGPVEGEFIRNETYESFHLIEVNPRFTAWIAFSAFAGSNHPYLAVCAALGRSPSMVREPEDLVFMRSCEDVHLDPTTLAALATKGTLRHA